jgi:hypothetical protein
VILTEHVLFLLNMYYFTVHLLFLLAICYLIEQKYCLHVGTKLLMIILIHNITRIKDYRMFTLMAINKQSIKKLSLYLYKMSIITNKYWISSRIKNDLTNLIRVSGSKIIVLNYYLKHKKGCLIVR